MSPCLFQTWLTKQVKLPHICNMQAHSRTQCHWNQMHEISSHFIEISTSGMACSQPLCHPQSPSHQAVWCAPFMELSASKPPSQRFNTGLQASSKKKIASQQFSGTGKSTHPPPIPKKNPSVLKGLKETNLVTWGWNRSNNGCSIPENAANRFYFESVLFCSKQCPGLPGP